MYSVAVGILWACLSFVTAQDPAPELEAGRFLWTVAEAESLNPSRLRMGDPVTPGPVLLLGAEGTMKIIRGRGRSSLGPAKPPRIQDAGLEEVEEQEEGPAARKATKKPRAERDEAGKFLRAPEVRLQRGHQSVTLTASRGGEGLTGKTLDPVRLSAWLRELRDATAAEVPVGGRRLTPREHLSIQCWPEVTLGDFMAVWDAARSVGFKTLGIMADPIHGGRPTDEVDGFLAGLPDTLGWKKRDRVYDEELLVMADRSTTMAVIVPLYLECARAGIWRIALVGRGAEKRMVKLPTPLPVDR